jgi:hypothetical protein
VKQAMVQIRIPNAECRKTGRSVEMLGSPGNAQATREGVCRRQHGTGGSDFGFRTSDFGFHDAKPLDFHNENCCLGYVLS